MGGKNKKPVIGYRHFMGLYMGESRTSDYLAAVDVGGEIAWEGELSGSGSISINKPSLFGGDKKEGGIVGTLRVRQGEPTQMPDAYLQAQVPGPWPAARGLCTTVFDGQIGAMNPYIKLWKKRWGGFTAGWTTPVWQPSLCKIGRGKNPMHILYQFFTDTRDGLAFSPSVIDEQAWLSAAQTLHDEGFGLCLAFRRASGIGNYIRMICDHVGGMWAQDPRTGLITFRLFRPDYDATMLPLLDESSIIAMDSFEQPALDTTTNEVTIVGRDVLANKDISVTYQNLANVQAQGRVINTKRQYPGLWNREQCAMVAARDCAIESSLLARIKCTVKADFWGVKRGDVLALSWKRKGWVRVPVRVLEVDEGTRTDSRIALTLVQDFSGAASAVYVAPSQSVWTRPDDTPRQLPAQRVYEATWRDLVQTMSAADLAQVSPLAGYLAAVGSAPAGVSYGYDLHTRLAGGEYSLVGSGEYAPTGLLQAAVGIGDVTFELDAAQDLDGVHPGDEWICESEHGRVVAVNAAAATITVARGCVDSVPAAHPAGARVWFSDSAAADPTQYAIGDTVHAKLLARTRNGIYPIEAATQHTLGVQARQGRPYPPGLLRVAGNAQPVSVSSPFVVTWAHRDRLLQADQLIDHEAASIGPEPGTRYAIRALDAANAVLAEKLDIAGTSATVALAHAGSVRLELYAITDAGASLQRHVRLFAHDPAGTTVSVIAAPTWAPDSYILDGGGP